VTSPGAVLGTAEAGASRALILGPDPIPVVVVRPAGAAPWPVVVLLHGANDAKESNLPSAVALAGRGVAVVLPDLRRHGERASADVGRDGPIPILDYVAICTESTADVGIVVAAARRDVGLCDGRVGLLGASMGGQIALLAAIADPDLGPIALISPMIHDLPIDPASYPLAAGQETRLAHDSTALDILGRSDQLAGRALLMIHGRNDEVAPYETVRLLHERLTATDDGPAGAVLMTHGGGHGAPEALAELSTDWLVRSFL
jgi:dienelactone hydrolase